MKFLGKLIVLIILVIIGLGAWVWSGNYDVGADSPDTAFTNFVTRHVRERSIAVRADDITVPDNLDDPAVIAEGAHHYARMCAECHLAPGKTDSELRAGLHPQPPNLTRFSPAPAEAFWIIKHGIKMTAMPAWGKTHSDQKIWAMVAYLQKQPHISVERYHELAGLTGHTRPMMMHGSESARPGAGTTHGAPMVVTPAPTGSAAAPVPSTTTPAPATTVR